MMKNEPGKDRNKFTGCFYIKNLVIPVYLGVTEEEKSKLQNISIDLRLSIDNIPIGCDSDDIGDTICYQKICDEITSLIKHKKFNLIERICKIISSQINFNKKFSKISVVVNKLPKIEGLEGGVSFELTNFTRD